MTSSKTTADIYKLIIEVRDELRDEVTRGFNSVNEQLQEARDERTKIMRDVSNLQRDITRLEERIEHFGGFAKEIDELRTRLTSIEKHLGMVPAITV